MSSGMALLVLAGAISTFGCPQLRRDDFRIGAAPDAASPEPSEEACQPFAFCEQACVDTQSNPDHCGACGSAVADGQICAMGRGVDSNVGCGSLTLCRGGCVDTRSHPFFCGGCDGRCAPGQRCAMGRCECAGASPKNCGGVCRQCCTNSDCRGDRTCVAGVCDLSCAAPLSPCTDDCVDLETDPKNCGTCRNDCGPDATCADGACG